MRAGDQYEDLATFLCASIELTPLSPATHSLAALQHFSRQRLPQGVYLSTPAPGQMTSLLSLRIVPCTHIFGHILLTAAMSSQLRTQTWTLAGTELNSSSCPQHIHNLMLPQHLMLSWNYLTLFLQPPCLFSFSFSFTCSLGWVKLVALATLELQAIVIATLSTA